MQMSYCGKLLVENFKIVPTFLAISISFDSIVKIIMLLLKRPVK